MIWIYEQGFEDFSTNGLGSITPTRCKVSEEQNGAYELEMDHPIDEDGLFSLLKTGRVLKVPVPAQTTPMVRMPAVTSYEVWKTNAKAKVYTKKSTALGSTVTVEVPVQYDTKLIRPVAVHFQDTYTTTKWKPNGNRVLESVEVNIEVSVLKKDGSWYQVTSPKGSTGWMQASALTLVRTVAARPPETIQERKVRDQLFRIYRAEKDTKAGSVKVWARHISYDLLGNVLLDCDVKDKTVTQAIATIEASCTQTGHGFTIYTDSTATISADWSRKGYLEALLDPDEGLLSLANLRLVRDNYDLFLLERSEVSRQSVSYGTNLMGVTLDINEDSIVNRIVPVGKTKDGEPLYIDAEYVDSPRNNEATIIRAKVIEYSDVAEKDAKGNEPAVTLAQAKTALIAKANDDFEAGIDLPDITVDVDFLQLGDTVEYAAYRDLDRLYLGDIITVRDDVHGVLLDAEITQVEYDALVNRYTRMNVGVTEAARTIGSTASFMLPNGSLGGRKIAMGGIDNGHIKELSAEKITTGTLDAGVINVVNLNADNISTGYLDAGIIEAGTITATHIGTNEIVANAANIKDGVITNAKIANGTIENAKIKDATIETAKIKDAAITTAKIADAQVTNAKIANATIETAKIKDAAITTAKIQDAQITNAKIAAAGIDFANIKDVVAGTSIFRQGVGDALYLDRLVVNDANFASAIAGKLMIRDTDGKLYRISVNSSGAVTATQVQVNGDSLTDNAVMSVSQRLLWRQATQPSAPWVGMLWLDTTTEKLKRCTAITPSVAWEVVPAGEVHTAVIDVDDNGMNILSGGNLNLLSGGSLNIKNLGDTANIINMDNTGLTLSSTGQLKLQSTDSIIIGGSPFSVGGTNLIPNSAFDSGLTGWGYGGWAVVQQDYRVFGHGLAYVEATENRDLHTTVTYIKPSTAYTVSFWNHQSGGVGSNVLFCQLKNASDAITSTKAFEVTTARGVKSFTFTTDNDTNKITLIFRCYAGNNFYIGLTKLEEGTTATDWSPAPSDPGSGVKTASITIDDGGIDLTASDKITVNGGSFVTTIAENVVTTASGSIISTVKNDSDWLGKGAADERYSQITQTNESINLAVSSIQVGSSNIMLGSKGFTVPWEFEQGWISDSIYKGFLVKRRQGAWGGLYQQKYYTPGWYVYSAYVKTDIGTNLVVITEDGGTAIFEQKIISVPATNEFQRIEAAFRCTSAGNAIVRLESSSADRTVWICGIQIQEGNKATPWSPSPSDPTWNRNLLSGSRDFSGTWNNSQHWTTDGELEGFTVKKRTGQWSGIGQIITYTPGVYTISAMIRASEAMDIAFYAGTGFMSQVIPVSVNTSWTRQKATFICTQTTTLSIRPEMSVAGKTLWVCDMKIEKGMDDTGWEPQPNDPASSVKTSKIEIGPDYIDIGTGGNINLSAGAKLIAEAGTIQLEAANASGSVLQFGDALNISEGDSGYQLSINSTTDDAIQVNNNPVWHKGNIVVQEEPPASGNGVIWVRPLGGTATVSYSASLATNLEYAGNIVRSWTLSNTTGDTMSAGGTYTFAVTFKLQRTTINQRVPYINTTGGTIVLTKGSGSLTIQLPQLQFGPWSQRTVSVTGTSNSTAFTSGPGTISAAITLTGAPSYGADDFIQHVRPSDITCKIDGPGASGTAQAVEIKFVP